VALRDDHVLLARSSYSFDNFKLWWLPGGGVDFRESLDDALRREFREECGLEVLDAALLSVVDDEHQRSTGEWVHTVRIIYAVTLGPGELVAETDGTTDLVTWVALSDLDAHRVTPYARAAIGAALAHRDGTLSLDAPLSDIWKRPE
jgi:ADP-ribose pyrophosphatase YjhB (NUDIX family)